METNAALVLPAREAMNPIDEPHRMNIGGTTRRVAKDCNALRAERYRDAETRLIQSLRRCYNEPSVHELKIRTLERATHLLSQSAQQSGDQARQLAALTADRASLIELDPDSYRSMLCQRWRAERRHDSISHHVNLIKQIVGSLSSCSPPTFISPDADITSPAGKHEEDHLQGLEDRSTTNLVAFLCYPRRVAHLRCRARSPLLNTCLRPLSLNAAFSSSTDTQISLPTTSQPDTSSDSNLDMPTETTTELASLADQQAQLVLRAASKEDVGTAWISSPSVPPPHSLDPSTIDVELPSYVHDLLANFDASGDSLRSISPAIKFQTDDSTVTNNSSVKHSLFTSIRRLRKERGSNNIRSPPTLRPKSSLKRLSGIFSMSETMASRRKVDASEGGSSGTTLLTEMELNEDSTHTHGRSSSSSSAIGKMASKLGQRISFVNSKR